MPHEHRNLEDGWDSWSKHVLKELQRLNIGQDHIQQEMHNIKVSMNEMAVLKISVDELKRWREGLSEVVSTSQLKDYINKTEELEKFKIKAIAIFTFVQITFGTLVGVALKLLT